VKSKDLHAVAVKMLEGWPQKARDFVGSGDSESFLIVGMSTSVPGVDPSDLQWRQGCWLDLWLYLMKPFQARLS